MGAPIVDPETITRIRDRDTNPGQGGDGGGGSDTGGSEGGRGIPAPIIVHDIRTDEPNLKFFLLEWGPDDGDDTNILKVALPAQRVVGDDEWVSLPYMITDTILGDWYRFRVSCVNEFGWKSATVPITEGWVYQRAGNDEDDLDRFDEVVNLLPNSDFEFDQLLNGDFELPYWEYEVSAGSWATPIMGDGQVDRGLFGRLTDHNLILKPGEKLRSDFIAIYGDRPYALSGYFMQDAAGLGDLTFRLSYYDVDDNFLESDYVLEREPSMRVFTSSTWPGGSIFEPRDRYGTVFYPADGAAYAYVEIINDGTADIWADDLMLSQTSQVTKYVSWDRESIETYIRTIQYRRDIPPSGTLDWDALVPIESFANEDGSADIKIRWNWTEGTYPATGFVVYGNLANSGVASVIPGSTDYDFAFKTPNATVRKYDLVGVNPVNRYSFTVAPYATTRSGMTLGTEYTYQSGPNDPGDPDTLDWVDFQSSSTVDLMSAPRTELQVISETATSTTVEFIVTSPNGEDTATYYRLAASGTFSVVPEISSIPTLTVNRDQKDVVIYYYSQGLITGHKESMLEFVIDKNRVPSILTTDSEYDPATRKGIVYWYGDDDVESVHWDIDDGPVFITSGTSGNTGWFSIAPGETKTVDLDPRGRGQQGKQVSVSVSSPAAVPRIQLNVESRTSTDITVSYEVEGFGDATVVAYSRVGNSGTYSTVPEVLGVPTETIQRDDRDLTLHYFASGTTTGLLSNPQSFTIDVDRTPEIIQAEISYDNNNDLYTVYWWADDDTDYVTYQVDSGTIYVVSGTAGNSTPQAILPSESHIVDLTPYGPTGQGTTLRLFPTRDVGSDLPPYLVISGVTNGSDGGGAFVLVDVFSYTVDGNLGGSIEYAEGNATFTDAMSSTLQHKVYRGSSDILLRYRAYVSNRYSDTVTLTIDPDDLPEIRPSIELSNDQEFVRIQWDGDDDVASVGILPSGASVRYVNQQSGFDQDDAIALGQTLNYTITPYTDVDGGGTSGKVWPLRVTRVAGDAPWMSIARSSFNNSVVPATITLKFDAENTADNVYYTTSGSLKPGDPGWTSISNGGTQAFNRPTGEDSLIVRGYAAKGTLYSNVVTYTVDPDEVPVVTDAWYDPDWDNDEATLNWDIDDDTDAVQLYLNGSQSGSPIASSTTNATITGMTPGVVKTYTIVPIRGSAEFPQNGKTVVIAREDEFAFDGRLRGDVNTDGTVDLYLKVTGKTNAFDIDGVIYADDPTGSALQTHTFTATDEEIGPGDYASLNNVTLPAKTSRQFYAKLTNAQGTEKWLFIAADRDSLPGGSVSIKSNYTANPIIRCVYDDDTTTVTITTPSGDKTYTGLSGGGTLNYTVGVTTLDSLSAESALAEDEERDGYHVEFSGGGTDVVMFDGTLSGPVPTDETGNYLIVNYKEWIPSAPDGGFYGVIGVEYGDQTQSIRIVSTEPDGSGIDHYIGTIGGQRNTEIPIEDDAFAILFYNASSTETNPLVRLTPNTGVNGTGTDGIEKRVQFISVGVTGETGGRLERRNGEKFAGEYVESRPLFEVRAGTGNNPQLGLNDQYAGGSVSSTYTPNYNNGPVQSLTLSGDTTIQGPTNMLAGETIHLRIDTNGHTLDFDVEWEFAGGPPAGFTGVVAISAIKFTEGLACGFLNDVRATS